MEHQTISEIPHDLSVQGKFSTQVAIASFAIGTLLFAAFLLMPDKTAIFIAGFFYVAIAAFANGVILVNLLYYFIICREERENLAIKIMIVLANVPIAAFYFYILFIADQY